MIHPGKLFATDILLPVACALLVSFSCPAQSNAVEVMDGRTPVRGVLISYLPSGDSLVTLESALRAYRSGWFQPNQHPDLNLGIAKDNYWVRFSLVNQGAGKKVNVVLENPRLNEVEAFVIQGDSVLSHLLLGDNFPFAARVIRFNQFAFPVQLAQASPVDVFLYVRHKGNTLQMPITVMDDQTFISWIEMDYLIAGVTTGIFCITFFFGVFFLFNTRDRLFIYYSGYIFMAGLWLWATEGFGFQYLWPTHPELATRLGPGISGLSACFFMASCLQFCKPYDSNSLFRKGLIVLLAFLIVWSVQPILPFVPITEKSMAVFLSVYFSMNLLIAISLAVYLVRLSLKGHVIVLYYFFAVAVTMLCSFLIVLRGGGIIDLPVSSGILMSAGYVLEIILMTAGITKQFYNYKKEREDTLLAYLEQQKTITKKVVDTVELERKRIGRELHDDIGSGLTQIALMSESAKQYNTSDPGNVKELNDIAATTRGLVNSIGEIIWAMNPGNRSLGQLLVYLREQLNKLLEYSGMAYTIQFPDDNNPLELDNTQLRNLLLIAKEAVNNAVKYSRARKISITSRCQDGTIFFEIADDGIGMDLQKVKLRNGIRNMRLRTEEMGGKLEILSEPGSGTVCRYQVPVQTTTLLTL